MSRTVLDFDSRQWAGDQCRESASLQLATIPVRSCCQSEQVTIAAFLDRETAKIDGMVAKVDAAIERLQEYRTALITAAVTGKVDVRGAVA